MIKEVGLDEWKNFLSTHEHEIIHTPQFKSFIEVSFPSVKGWYLGEYRESKLEGIFPFFHIKISGILKFLSWTDIFSSKTISCAFNDYGGWTGNISDPIAVIEKVHVSTKTSSVEIRGNGRCDLELPSLSYKRFLLSLTIKEKVWQGIQKEKRKAIKKAEHDGVIVRDVALSEINAFYHLYLCTMREFGTPPFPRSYFVNFYSYFIDEGLGKIMGAYVNGNLAAFLLGYTCNKRVHISILASDHRYQIHRVNDVLHWKFIEWALEGGYQTFDFGRTRENSGQFEYKKKWGGEMKDLTYFYKIYSGSLPHIDPTNSSYALAIKVYKQLPLWVTEKLGAKLRVSLGI